MAIWKSGLQSVPAQNGQGFDSAKGAGRAGKAAGAYAPPASVTLPANTRARGAAFKKRAVLALCLCGLTLMLTACAVNKASAYNRAIATFASGDYAQAAIDFDKLDDFEQATTYAAYTHGLALYEQGDFVAAEPYFEKTQSFMTGKQRYAYCHAAALQAAGSFDEASKAYHALGDFENAPLCAAYCAGRYAEDQKDYETALFEYDDAATYADSAERLSNLQTQVYDHAKELKASGDYVEALNWFGLLGDYFDARAQAKTCKDFVRDQQYDQAEAYEKQGDLQRAYDMFTGLSGYRDAQTRAGELANRLGIAAAEDDTTQAAQ